VHPRGALTRFRSRRVTRDDERLAATSAGLHVLTLDCLRLHHFAM